MSKIRIVSKPTPNSIEKSFDRELNFLFLGGMVVALLAEIALIAAGWVVIHAWRLL